LSWSLDQAVSKPFGWSANFLHSLLSAELTPEINLPGGTSSSTPQVPGVWQQSCLNARGCRCFQCPLVQAPGQPFTVRGDRMLFFVREFWSFVRARKKFWLLPILATMLIFGALLVLAQGSAVAPFIYTLF
jgi:hypothetical protein